MFSALAAYSLAVHAIPAILPAAIFKTAAYSYMPDAIISSLSSAFEPPFSTPDRFSSDR